MNLIMFLEPLKMKEMQHSMERKTGVNVETVMIYMEILIKLKVKMGI